MTYPEGPTTPHGKTFFTPRGVPIIVPHPPIHILPKKPLRRLSLAQLQQVPTVRPPTVRALLPSMPKTTSFRYHHYQTTLLEPLGILTAPDVVTLLEPFRVYILKAFNSLKPHFFALPKSLSILRSTLPHTYQSRVARYFQVSQ